MSSPDTAPPPGPDGTPPPAAPPGRRAAPPPGEPPDKLPPALSSMWRLCRLGFRYEPALMGVAFVLALVAALPDALLAVWFKLLGEGLLEHKPGLLRFADGCVLVAHNAPFDIGFLRAACGQCGLAWPGFTVLDTVMLARRVMDPDEVPDCKLGTLAGFFRAHTAPSHRALADARATADVLGWLIRRLAHRGVRTLGQLSAWPDVVA